MSTAFITRVCATEEPNATLQMHVFRQIYAYLSHIAVRIIYHYIFWAEVKMAGARAKRS